MKERIELVEERATRDRMEIIAELGTLTVKMDNRNELRYPSVELSRAQVRRVIDFLEAYLEAGE